jgi:hypothetical protein
MAQCVLYRQYISADDNVPSLVFPWRAQQTNLIQEKEMQQEILSVLPICQGIAYLFCFTGAETEIHKIKDDSKIKREKNIDCRSQRHIGNVWHLSDPPSFSLPTTQEYTRSTTWKHSSSLYWPAFR